MKSTNDSADSSKVFDGGAILPSSHKRNELPDFFVDNKKDIGGVQGFYKSERESSTPNVYEDLESSDKLSGEYPSNAGSTNSIIPNSNVDLEGNESLPQLTGVKEEKWWQTTIQVSIPFLIAGVGTIGAGIILGHVKNWDAFRKIPELFILVPALLGLKGNLDMALAARLSTQANIGNMSSKKEVVHMVVGNISIVQIQAAVASFLVSLFSIGMGVALNGTFSLNNAFLLTASAMFTAAASCFVLDFVLVGVILLAHRFKVNPDNLATPMASSIGDLVTITVLSFITAILYANLESYVWVTYVVIAVFFLLLPLWVVLVLRNRYTRPVLTSGWIPVLGALIISSLGGLVLESAVEGFSGFVVFSPIISGVGGNLVSVQACKISTRLYQGTVLGKVPSYSKILENPFKALIYGTPYAKSARILIIILIPGAVIFIFIADLIHVSRSTIGAPFVFSYLLASLIQVIILLYLAHLMVHGLWRYKIDPDTAAIPFLTSIGDLVGSLLLFGVFTFLEAVGHGYEGRPDSMLSKFLTDPFDYLVDSMITF